MSGAGLAQRGAGQLDGWGRRAQRPPPPQLTARRSLARTSKQGVRRLRGGGVLHGRRHALHKVRRPRITRLPAGLIWAALAALAVLPARGAAGVSASASSPRSSPSIKTKRNECSGTPESVDRDANIALFQEAAVTATRAAMGAAPAAAEAAAAGAGGGGGGQDGGGGVRRFLLVATFEGREARASVPMQR